MGDETNDGAAQGGATPSTTARFAGTGELMNPPAAAAAAAEPAATPAPAAAPTRAATAAAAMPPEQFNVRLRREREASDRKWAEAAGVKTPDEMKAKLAKLAELEAKETESRLAEMTELDRVKAQLAAANEEIAQLRAATEEAQTETAREREVRILEGIGGKVLKPRYVRVALTEFREHLRTLEKEDVETMKPREVERWFSTYAKENPELALGDPAEQPAAAVAAPVAAVKPAARRPITNGRPPPKRPDGGPVTTDAPHMLHGKTVRPGQPNSMTPAEVRAFAKANCVDYPGMGSVNQSRPR